VWRSRDGRWQVTVRTGWTPTSSRVLAGDYYQVVHLGALHAEVGTIDELARIVPLHELVEYPGSDTDLTGT